MSAVSATGTGATLGTVSIEQTAHGVVFTPSLTGLEPATTYRYRVVARWQNGTRAEDGGRTEQHCGRNADHRPAGDRGPAAR